MLPDKSEIARGVATLFEPDQVVEIRLFDGGKQAAYSGYYDDHTKLVEDVFRLDSRPEIEGAYWTAQVIDPQLLNRYRNRAQHHPKLATADHQVKRYRWLLIDVDPRRPAGISSTNAQKLAASTVIDRIALYFYDLGFAGIQGDSGNGWHLYYRIDLENDAEGESKLLVSRVLKALAARFDTEEVALDRTVFNAGRIFKVPGTVARKGDSSPDCPHRLSRLLGANGASPKLPIVPREVLEAIAAEAPDTPVTPAATDGADRIEKLLTDAGIAFAERQPWETGFKWILEKCPFNPDHVASSVIVTFAAKGPGFKCSHNSCAENHWPQFLAKIGASWGESTATVTPAGWCEPAPILLDALPPVPIFEPELLPESLRPLSEDVAERMQVPLDFPAVTSVVALAGCINRRAIIRPKVRDTAWELVLNLWGGLIAPPGYMKSPLLRAVTQPLVGIAELWRQTYQQELAEHELEKEKMDLKRQAWREQVKAAYKNGKPEPISPDLTLAEPTERRLIVTDVTPEKLHEILSHNPAGVLVLRDELTGWLAELERSGRETERGFYLQAWNGDAPFTMDRIGRGTVHVPAVCTSLVGLIQPARLRYYLSDVLQHGPSDDGLFQRFQLLVWPDVSREWRLTDRPPSAEALQLFARVCARLSGLSADSPVRLRFSNDAQELFYAWWGELEREVRGDELSHFMAAHLSKYRSLMPKLSAIFELTDRAATADLDILDILDAETEVSLDHARQAAGFCEYLRAHAQRIYSCVISPELAATHELARAIRRGGLPDGFSTREVYQHHWSGLAQPETVRAACEILEDAGWIRRETVTRGGRPSERWNVNPRLTGRQP